MAATFTLDPAAVVTASSDRTARLWDVETREQLRPAAGVAPLSPPRTLVRSPDGTAVASATGADVRLERNGRLLVLRAHMDIVKSVAFAPEGETVVTASRDHDVRLWNAVAGPHVATLAGHFEAVVDARFSPDGRFVVTAGPVTAGLWDATTGELIELLEEERRYLR